MSFNIKPDSVISQLLKDFGRVNNSNAVETRTNSVLQNNAESFLTKDSVSIGDPIILRGDGNVENALNKTPITGLPLTPKLIGFSTIRNKYLIVNTTNSATGRLTSSTITWGSSTTHSSFTLTGNDTNMIYISEYDRFVIIDDNDLIIGYVTEGSENAFFTNRIEFFAGSLDAVSIKYSTSLGKLLIVYSRVADRDVNNNLYLLIGTIDSVNNTITFASPILLQDTFGNSHYTTSDLGYTILNIHYLESRGVFVIFGALTFSYYPVLWTGTIDVVNNRVNMGSTQAIHPGYLDRYSGSEMTSLYDSINDVVVLFIINSFDYAGIAMTVEPTNSNDYCIIYSPIKFDATVTYPNVYFDANTGKFLVSYWNDFENNIKIACLSIDPIYNTLTLDDAFTVIENDAGLTYMTYDVTNSKLLYTFETRYKLFDITTPVFRNQYQFIGFANENRNANEIVTVTMFGVNDKQSSLSPGAIYYVGESDISTTSNNIEIGRALSSTEMEIRLN